MGMSITTIPAWDSMSFRIGLLYRQDDGDL
jgi:hypothetical protein